MLEMNLLNAKKKIGGVGYLIEELTNAQFTTYANVSNLSGVNAGTLHNEGSGWLRFVMDDKELIVSKKPMRNYISWNHLNSVGCVFGTKIVTINGNQYKVRLLTGADHNPAQVAYPGYGYYLAGTHNSEWSRLFYPLVRDDVNVPTRDPNAPYTNADLGMTWVNEETTPGAYNWCQEAHPGTTNGRVVRGSNGVSHLHRFFYSQTSSSFGWRACLELVP